MADKNGPTGELEPAEQKGSKRGIIVLLAGLVVAGLAIGYSWIKQLPKG